MSNINIIDAVSRVTSKIKTYVDNKFAIKDDLNNISDEIYGHDKNVEAYNGSYKVSGNATTAMFTLTLKANETYLVTLSCDDDVLSTDSSFAVGVTYEESGYKQSLFALKVGNSYKFIPTENVTKLSIWLPSNNAGYLYLSIIKEDIKIGVLSKLESINESLKQVTGTFSIIGDSYSTFEGWLLNNNVSWYPKSTNEITSVKQTWWHLFSKKTGYSLVKNESYSGATVCTTGYDGADSTTTAFITRMKSLGEDNINYVKPNIIFVFGGLNDSWADSPVGEVKYDTFETDDLKSFLPAYSYLINYLQTYNPNSRIISIIPSTLKEDMKAGISQIVKHYCTESIIISGYTTEDGHPNIGGMETICNQIIAGL